MVLRRQQQRLLIIHSDRMHNCFFFVLVCFVVLFVLLCTSLLFDTMFSMFSLLSYHYVYMLCSARIFCITRIYCVFLDLERVEVKNLRAGCRTRI